MDQESGLPADSAQRLERLRAEARKTMERDARALAREFRRHRGPSFRWRHWPAYSAVFLTAAVLPILVLLGGAVRLYRTGMMTWLAIGLAAFGAASILTVCAAILSKTLTGRARLRVIGIRVVAPSVLAFGLFGLLYLSNVNAKSEEVRQHYLTVHPMLRLALGTAILADKALVITAGFRVPQDYDAMGLPRYENSLHFKQRDGYVHAVDLRTSGRSPVRNVLLVTYFRMLGFRTLRHVGTADHLHVSLPA